MKSLFVVPDNRMDQLFGNTIAFDVSVNFGLVVAVVTESIKDLRQRQMG